MGESCGCVTLGMGVPASVVGCLGLGVAVTDVGCMWSCAGSVGFDWTDVMSSVLDSGESPLGPSGGTEVSRCCDGADWAEPCGEVSASGDVCTVMSLVCGMSGVDVMGASDVISEVGWAVAGG